MSSDPKHGVSPAPDLSHRARCRAAHQLSICEPAHADRPLVERFVQDAFAAKFGARVQSFLPHLLTVRGAERQLCAVAGYRGAGEERLYLENYLDAPIEQVFAAHCGKSIERRQVVEVGNLASSRCRMARQLVAALPAHLLAQGYVWIAFTATLAVRQILAQFGAPVIDLGPASPSKVAHLGDAWGSYYDNEPRILAGYLADGLHFSAITTQARPAVAT